jgi:hypothetical protein
MRLLEQPDHPRHGDLARLGSLNWAELRGRDGDGAVGHGIRVSCGGWHAAQRQETTKKPRQTE